MRLLAAAACITIRAITCPANTLCCAWLVRPGQLLVSFLGPFQHTAHHLLAVHLLLGCCAVWQVRKFANEQYAATGLTMHPLHTPVEVKKQDNGKLTIVIADKEGNKTEITDNDQVWHETETSCPTTACTVCCGCWGCVCRLRARTACGASPAAVLTLSPSHATTWMALCSFASLD